MLHKSFINKSLYNNLINTEDKSLGILYDEVYYYDIFKNNNFLIKLNIQDKKLKIKKLLDEKPLILIYGINI